MKNLEKIIQILLGILILISGLNKFGYWINVSYMEDALTFVVDLSNIGGEFLIYALGILEILIGVALIINKFKTLAVLSLLPLMVFILAFHIFLDLNGIVVAIFVFALNLFLLFKDKTTLSKIFSFNS